MYTKTLKTKLVPALALALLMAMPMLLATMPIVKASSNSTPVLSVVLSGTTSTRLIPGQSVGSTFNVDVRVDNTSIVSPGINSYSYGLTWNPAVLNVTNVNDAFSGSLLNSGANLGTVESLGDLPVNNTKGLLVVGDIILNTSDFAACATGSGVLTTVTFKVLAAGQSNINLQQSDTGIAYLTYPDNQGHSHDVIATTADAAYVSLTPSNSEIGITGYKLVFSTTLTNMFGNAQNINYSWSYDVYKYNMTTKTYNIAVTSGVTPTKIGYSVPTGTATLLSREKDAVLPTTLSWNTWIEVFSTFVYMLTGNTYTLALPATVLNVHPGDIAGVASITFPYLGADGSVNLKDLTLIALSYLKSVPAGTDPTSTLARADINGDGAVNLRDLTYIALEYLKSYSFTPPATI
jgi:hypothetical protein